MALVLSANNLSNPILFSLINFTPATYEDKYFYKDRSVFFYDELPRGKLRGIKPADFAISSSHFL